MIFSVSAINFSLKSEEEQNALIFQYQSFLNSLHFPIQIVMRSKRLDLNPYIKRINEVKDKQKSELIKLQTEDYVDFISELINLANIMKKTFYVVVPYDPITVKSSSILDKILSRKDPGNLRIPDQEFKRYKEELAERANVVATGLGTMGLHCVQLNTEEIIELFYKIYNPDIADKERFSNVDEITASYVADVHEKKGEKIEDQEEAEKSESIIDNSAIVEEKHKKESQLKEMEAQKTGEKQIVKNVPAPAKETVLIQQQPTPVTNTTSASINPTAPAANVQQASGPALNSVPTQVQNPAGPVVAPPVSPAPPVQPNNNQPNQ